MVVYIFIVGKEMEISSIFRLIRVGEIGWESRIDGPNAVVKPFIRAA